MRLTVAPPALDVSSPQWLVFRISGNGVVLTAPLVAGAAPERRDAPGGVQVYACGDRDLTGRLDAARGVSLKRAYGIAC